MTTTFLLVRHGEPRYDEIKVNDPYGLAWDFGRLTDQGVLQAKERAKDPRFKDAELIISSPYTRALETAAIIAGKTGLDVRVENDLHEWSPDLTFSYGFSEKRADQMKEIMKEYHAYKGERPEDSSFYYESISDVKKRVLRVLNRYKNYRKVIVVCHGIVMNSVIVFDDYINYFEVRVLILLWTSKN